MSEFRRDPITGRWVIIAAPRSKRTKESKQQPCPFCSGNEQQTPPEIRVFPPRKPANSSGWLIRVVPNKFNAAGIEEHLQVQPIGLYLSTTGYGAHEVIIESPHHDINFENQPTEQIKNILNIFKERVIDLYKDPAMKQVVIFKNQGKEAGASLSHPHAQLIAMPIVPIDFKQELNGAREYFKKERGCIWCNIIRQEMRMNIEILDESDQKIKVDPPKIRMIFENGNFVALCPFSSKFPYEAHIIPKRHAYSYEDIGEKTHISEISDLAEILKAVLKKINAAFKTNYSGGVPYNFVLHTAPNVKFGGNDGRFENIKDDFHWHIEIYPVLSTPAGFEKGSGFYINTVPPEDAARHLRETVEEEDVKDCK